MTYLIVLLAVLARFIPHPMNFSPVFGALLFGGARLRPRDAIWFPVALIAASDFVLTVLLYRMKMHWTHILVWAGFVIIAVLGRLLRSRASAQRVVAAAVAGPIAFFLISNFAVWLGFETYTHTWQGLLACYAAGIPFFRNSLASSVLFTAVLFGVEAFFRRWGSIRLRRRATQRA